MEQNIEPATEYYALLFENDGELDDIEEYIDAEERIIELAVGAIYGSLQKICNTGSKVDSS